MNEIITIIVLIFWTVASIWYTILNLGNKLEEPDRWYIWVLGIPTLIIAYIVGYGGMVIGYVYKRFKKD